MVELQRELELEPKVGLWFWDIGKQRLTLADWAAMMKPYQAVYNNKWLRECMLSPTGIVGDR